MQMIKDKKFIMVSLICLVITLICVVIIVTRKKDKESLLPLDLVSVKTSDGWGYKILVNHKLYINQEVIPAVNERRSFPTEEQAILTGKLVLQKMRNGQRLPNISLPELKQIGVIPDSTKH